MFRSLFDFEPHDNPYWPWDYFYPFYPLNTSTTWEKYDNTSAEDECDEKKCSEKPQTYYKEVYEEYVNGEKVKSKEREFINGKMTKNENFNKQFSETKVAKNEEKPKLEEQKEQKKDVLCGEIEKPSEEVDLRKQMIQLEKENKVLRKQQTKLISMLRQIIDEN